MGKSRMSRVKWPPPTGCRSVYPYTKDDTEFVMGPLMRERLGGKPPDLW
jgi:hypothetical protein